MAKPIDYEVARQHLGDRITDDGIKQHMFMPGETRTADPATVQHLIGKTLIDPTATKAEEAAPENKAEGNAPKNKSTKPKDE